MDVKQTVHEWRKDKILGTGGFGTVILWINKHTQEHIALKECRWGNDAIMTTKHRQRWKLEVDIMKRLNHPHVVKAVTVPSELDAPPSATMPLMAMEYCSGGDLRKALSLPENCCGLPEYKVRLILRHIVSAVRYLHSMRIIHRDLKPENIVMQENNGKQIYKLIDLGYAKELDQGSLCTSFVGTLQYLAPELFLSQTYSCTVDFWSLGLVTHEIVTGQRPFLPTMSPAQWIPVVRFKSSDDINAYVNDDSRVEFSSEISAFHQISKPFKKDIEEWLRIMLEFDPDKRGRRDGVNTFDIFENIMNKKVLNVFCLNTLEMLSFEPNDQHTVADIQSSLCVGSGIPVANQLLLLPKGGISPDPEQRALHCWSCPEVEEDICQLFLLSENGTSVGAPSSPSVNIPSSLESIMRQPKEPMDFEAQKVAWREAVFLSQQLTSRIQILTQGFKTCLLHLLRRNSRLHKTCATILSAMTKLKAKSEFSQHSLQLDLQLLREHLPDPSHLHQKWNKTESTGDNVDRLNEKVTAIEKNCTLTNSRTLEPQRSPYARTKHTSLLNETHNHVVSLFGKLKKKSRDQRALKCDNSEMVRLLCNSIKQYESQSKDIVNHIRLIEDVCKEVNTLLPRLDEVSNEIANLDSKVTQSQEARQKQIWSLLPYNNNIPAFPKPLMKDPNDNCLSATYNSVYNDTKENFPHHHTKERTQSKRVNPFTTENNQPDECSSASGPLTFILGSTLAPLTNPRDPQSLQDWFLLIQETAKSSQKLRKENAALRNDLGSMLNSLSKQQDLISEEEEQLFSVLQMPTQTKL